MASLVELQMRDCGHCGLKHAHMKLVVSAETIPAKRSSYRRQFVVLACPDCAGVNVVEYLDADTGPLVMATTPEEPGSQHRIKHLPTDVASYFDDAQRILEAGVPDGAAVSLRKTLEAAAAHHGKDQKVLVQRIKSLIDDGLVTRQFGEALTLIRQIGNQGAHATDERVDHESAELALRFTALFLRNLFELPEELRMATAAAEEAETAVPTPG